MRTPAAVMWDMDGTLVDSEPAWQRAAADLLAAHGATLAPDTAAALLGANMETTASALRSAGVDAADDEIIAALTVGVDAHLAEGFEIRPGAAALLTDLASASVPLALVSMSYRVLVDRILAALPPVFATSIAGDEVSPGKPAPDAYLLAASKLGVEPSECLVIEDSPTGVAAGRAAGATVIAAPMHGPIPPQAHLALPTLAGVDAAALCRAYDSPTSLTPTPLIPASLHPKEHS
ncbi:MAG: HAD family hydrolase [Demequina sp.]|uniref:HAD family hydrolase n=1 Tax=Demequina sp. TaxID=2050685 RepID=UPI003A8B4998